MSSNQSLCPASLVSLFPRHALLLPSMQLNLASFFSPVVHIFCGVTKQPSTFPAETGATRLPLEADGGGGGGLLVTSLPPLCHFLPFLSKHHVDSYKSHFIIPSTQNQYVKNKEVVSLFMYVHNVIMSLLFTPAPNYLPTYRPTYPPTYLTT